MKRLFSAAVVVLFALTAVLTIAGPAAAASSRCGEKQTKGQAENRQSCYPPGQQGNGPGNNGNGHGNEADKNKDKPAKAKPASAFQPYGSSGMTVGMLLGVLVAFALLSGVVRWRLAKWLK